MPSTAGYMAVAGGLALALFWVIWWLLRSDGEEAPWLPAGLAAGFVIFAAATAREVVMRRAWARYTREMDLVMGASETPRASAKAKSASANWSNMQAQVAALRGLQQRLSELDSPNTPPEAHHEAYKLCEQYLASAEEVLRAPGGAAEMRAALRSGQERVRAYQRKHMLSWARGETTRLTHEAQRRVRVSDRIETAQRALEVLEEAIRVYPDEQELRDSSLAVRNFVASVKVGQWVEMAERAAFRGLYERAVARYRDALFYLSRADMGEDARSEAAARIQREIDLLRARVRTTDLEADSASDAMRGRRAARDGGGVVGREGPPDLSAEGEELLG
jgi:tetratricopeptide (TPR) repeat protein